MALARALAPRPRLVLLDEPFSNLDADVRMELAQKLRAALEAEGATALLVTHDQQEAFAIADEIGVMRAGRLEQWDSPWMLYHSPLTRFVADFIGEGTFHSGQGAWAGASLHRARRHRGPADEPAAGRNTGGSTCCVRTT